LATIQHESLKNIEYVQLVILKSWFGLRSKSDPTPFKVWALLLDGDDDGEVTNIAIYPDIWESASQHLEILALNK
jgi:hypothetical protein